MQDDSYSSDRTAWRKPLVAAFALTLIFFFVEIIGGLISGSLALLADAAHMFTDLGALLIALAAMKLAARRPSEQYTFGLSRAEILAAFINAELLIGVSGYIFHEAYKRLQAPPGILTGTMIWVATSGFAANTISTLLLREKHQESLNLKAAYLETLTDALASLGVLVAAVVMRSTGWYWIDPVISAGIGLLVLPRAISLLRQSAHILLQGTPVNVDLAKLRRHILSIDGVEELHDLHFWTLTSGFNCISAHVRASSDVQGSEVLQTVQRLLKEEASVDHVTVQLERGSDVICEVSRAHD